MELKLPMLMHSLKNLRKIVHITPSKIGYLCQIAEKGKQLIQ